MSDIGKVDKNLAVETRIVREGLQFFDAESEPFQIYGVFKEDGYFRRMPENVAKEVNEGVYALHTCGAGGRVRFVTDSPYIAVITEYVPLLMPHIAVTGSAGFDMYAEYDGKTRYQGTFVPPFDVKDGYEAVLDLTPGPLRTVTINFPLYSSVKKLYIGLQEGCVLEKARDYRIKKPVVYYGSSITQGGCASKPGSSYESILSFKYDCDYINLGFSGSARGEDPMTEYIKGLDMSAFVLDYDYNSSSPEELQATHGKMYETIRAAHPDLPIVIMPRPKLEENLAEAERSRLAIVRATYLKARERGDRVYFINGDELLSLVGDNGTVDKCHPTDSGFLSMAAAISRIFDMIFKQEEEND